MTSDAEWKDAGTVLSFAKLGAVPDGFKVPMAIVLVEVEDNGPKVTCWSEEEHAVGDRVALTDSGGNSYVCERKSQPSP